MIKIRSFIIRSDVKYTIISRLPLAVQLPAARSAGGEVESRYAAQQAHLRFAGRPGRVDSAFAGHSADCGLGARPARKADPVPSAAAGLQGTPFLHL